MNQVVPDQSSEYRLQALQQWFAHQLSGLGHSVLDDVPLLPVSGDASFRRYFRAVIEDKSYILVDAPPDKENSQAFISIANCLHAADVNVPEIFASSLEDGVMCLEDFGDELLWNKLHVAQSVGHFSSAAELYHLAFNQLLNIQKCQTSETVSLQGFDQNRLTEEMLLFRDWFCKKFMRLNLNPDIIAMLDGVFDYLVNAAVEQQQVFVHRDYHSRNLMYRGKSKSLGVIDFQDAVIGPVTYDLVSLLKDCYIHWPRGQVNAWALEYARLAQQQHILEDFNQSEFLKAFDLMGVQRHLKVCGIFSRLHLRDQKSSYLRDIPRTLNYILEISATHPVLQQLHDWVSDEIMPDLENRINSALEKNI